MEGVVFRWIWTYMPDLESCMLYHLNEVEYLKSKSDFKTRSECINNAMNNYSDVMKNLPEFPIGLKGPFLYIMEYNIQNGILEKCSRFCGI